MRLELASKMLCSEGSGRLSSPPIVKGLLSQKDKYMLQNPFLLMPSAANAWAEGFTKGFVAKSSLAPSENVASEDIAAFNQGVAAGAESARSGISFGDPCIPAADEHGPLHVPGMVINAAEIIHGVWEARHLAKLAGGIAGVVVGLIELACTLPIHVLPPEQVLPALGQPMADALRFYGIESMELFCGAGLHATVPGCEICLTPLFPSFDQAHQAVIAMNRFQWVVASWRTDQSNSFRIVDSGE